MQSTRAPDNHQSSARSCLEKCWREPGLGSVGERSGAIGQWGSPLTLVACGGRAHALVEDPRPEGVHLLCPGTKVVTRPALVMDGVLERVDRERLLDRGEERVVVTENARREPGRGFDRSVSNRMPRQAPPCGGRRHQTTGAPRRCTSASAPSANTGSGARWRAHDSLTRSRLISPSRRI